MIHRQVANFLDITSGGTFVFGVITGQGIAIFLGGLASIFAIVNHLDQIYTRRYKKDK